MNEITAADIRRTAMDLLARREHSLQELRTKLLQKYLRQSRRDSQSRCVSDTSSTTESIQSLIEQQLARLAEENLQNDARFIESFINRKKSLGHGPQRIRYELRQKKISDTLIGQFLDDRDEQWRELARQICAKKFGAEKPRSHQEKAKRQRFMLQRGFSPWMLDGD